MHHALSQNYNQTTMQNLMTRLNFTQQPRLWQGPLWALTALFAIAAVVIAAQLSWQLLSPAAQIASGPLKISGSGSSVVDLGALKARNIFGNAGSAPVTQNRQQQAPLTRLNLRLLGVSASSVPARSAAIIEQAGQQNTYSAGDVLNNTQVKVLEIYADRVILENQGQRETLELEGIGELSPGLSLTMSAQLSASSAVQPAAQLATEPVISAETMAASILDYVSISPVRQGAGIQGYRLQAKKNPELFTAAGFQNGDLAIAINGQSLTDMNTAMALTRSLATMDTITVTVLRQGKTIELELAVPASLPVN